MPDPSDPFAVDSSATHATDASYEGELDGDDRDVPPPEAEEEKPEPITEANRPYQPFGGAKEMFYCKEPEVLIAGCAGGGKTASCLNKLFILAGKYPGMRGLIVRKTRESLTEAALVTWEDHVVPEHDPILNGPSRRLRQSYTFPNGSEIVIGGLDKSQKVMSTEYDIIYVQEATEVTEEDWENLTMRLRNGKMPYQQLIADCNPAGPNHWLKKRCDAGKTKLIDSRLEDNPRWFDPKTGKITPKGEKYVAKLDALTGVRRDRYRYGKWKQAEGIVYDGWDDRVHVVDPFPVPPEWPRYLAIDWGYNDPCAVGFFAKDPDGRLYMYKEIYQTGRLVEDIVDDILRLQRQELSATQDFVIAEANGDITDAVRTRLDELPKTLKPQAIVCDHALGERKTFEKHYGAMTLPAYKAITAGIQSVAERLKVQGDGKPRFMVFRDSLAHAPDEKLTEAKKPTRAVEEVDGYTWKDNSTKEQPVDDSNHSLDMIRYMCSHLEGKKPFYAMVVNV